MSLRPSSGLAADSVRQVLHDLRGPLNTIAIAQQLLSAGAAVDEDAAPASASTQAVAMLERSVRTLSTMLQRVESVSDSIAIEFEPIDLAEFLRASVDALPERVRNRIAIHLPVGQLPSVWSSAIKLRAALGTLFACLVSALPEEGTWGFRFDLLEGILVVRIEFANGKAVLPPSALTWKLDSSSPGEADWFRLACQIRGLAVPILWEGNDECRVLQLRFVQVA